MPQKIKEKIYKLLTEKGLCIFYWECGSFLHFSLKFIVLKLYVNWTCNKWQLRIWYFIFQWTQQTTLGLNWPPINYEMFHTEHCGHSTSKSLPPRERRKPHTFTMGAWKKNTTQKHHLCHTVFNLSLPCCPAGFHSTDIYLPTSMTVPWPAPKGIYIAATWFVSLDSLTMTFILSLRRAHQVYYFPPLSLLFELASWNSAETFRQELC